MTHEEAVEIVKSGDIDVVRKIDGQFSLVSMDGKTIRLAKSIGRPLSYFIVKRSIGPQLIVAERIDVIYDYLDKEGMVDQFHSSYTRMAPAHYITKIELLGCPDPSPVYTRFFTPERNKFSPENPQQIGEQYIAALYEEIKKWLKYRATTGPIEDYPIEENPELTIRSVLNNLMLYWRSREIEVRK